MIEEFAGISIAVIGGDERELVLISELVKQGADVRVVGFPPRPELTGAIIAESLIYALENVDVVILPMPGTDVNGRVKATYIKEPIIITDEAFSKLKPRALLLVGVAKQILKNMALRHRLKLIETANLDSIAVLNSIPTAEGAIQIAMEKLPITIHGCQALVLGFGRCGATLAGMLKALGAKVFITARKEADRARCYVQGFNTITYTELNQYLSGFDIIFNTVPSLVLERSKIALLNRNCLIVDIATAPGGTDFLAADEFGIQAVLTPSLPGKVAPKTAGKILASIYPGLILREISFCRGVQR